MDTIRGRKLRLISMMCMTMFYFLVELVFGYYTNSTSMVADSFHMLGDVTSLVIGFISVEMTHRKWSKNTFGWARAEVLGALVNSVFLFAMCFTIIAEAIKRFIAVEPIRNPMYVIIVGGIGLLINIVGLFLFHEHGHSHGASQTRLTKNPNSLSQTIVTVSDDKENTHLSGSPTSTSSKAAHKHSHSDNAAQMNLRGVFLHILMDAVGSIIVMISATVDLLTDWEYKYHLDPALSMISVPLIAYSTWPLLKKSSLILLQSAPNNMKVDEMLKRLLAKVEGVLSVHHLHVWQLTENKVIATAHIKYRNVSEYMRIARKVKEFFHNEGIHSTAIQAEFVDNLESSGSSEEEQIDDCVLNCPKATLSDTCDLNTCCRPSTQGNNIEIVVVD